MVQASIHPKASTMSTEPVLVNENETVIPGSSGVGKCSFMASLIKFMIENPSDRKILTYESPIEYVYDRVRPKDTQERWDARKSARKLREELEAMPPAEKPAERPRL